MLLHLSAKAFLHDPRFNDFPGDRNFFYSALAVSLHMPFSDVPAARSWLFRKVYKELHDDRHLIEVFWKKTHYEGAIEDWMSINWFNRAWGVSSVAFLFAYFLKNKHQHHIQLYVRISHSQHLQ